MNPLIQISPGKTSDSSKTTWAKAASSDSASTGEFDVLLSKLAGIGCCGDSATASEGKAASGSSADAKGKASADQKKRDTLSSMEERLLEIISSGRTATKQKGNSGSKSESVSAYAAGNLLVAGYQQGKSAGKNSSSSSAAPPTAEGDNATVDSALEREISAYLETAANHTGSGEDPSATSADGKTRAANEPTSAQTAGGNYPIEKDLLKLISAARDGNADGKVLKELDALIAKTNAGDGSSVKGVTHDPKSDPATPSASKTKATAESAAHTSVDYLSGRIRAAKQDLTGTIVADSKAESTNPAGIGGSASNAKGLGVKGANVDQPGSPVVSQATSANQAAKGTDGKASQDQAVVNQTVQAQQVRLDQGSRDAADSGRNQADTSKFASAQAFAAPANNNQGISFSQALSAAPQNVANPTTINLQQLAQGIVKQVSLMTLQGKKIVNMKLEPESLGSVSLQVVSDGSKISAQFNVRTADAKMFLESSVPQMKQMLETNGVTLSHLSVSLSGGEPQSGNRQYRYKPRKQSVKYFSDPSESVVPVGSPEISRSFGYNTMEMQV